LVQYPETGIDLNIAADITRDKFRRFSAASGLLSLILTSFYLNSREQKAKIDFRMADNPIPEQALETEEWPEELQKLG